MIDAPSSSMMLLTVLTLGDWLDRSIIYLGKFPTYYNLWEAGSSFMTTKGKFKYPLIIVQAHDSGIKLHDIIIRYMNTTFTGNGKPFKLELS